MVCVRSTAFDACFLAVRHFWRTQDRFIPFNVVPTLARSSLFSVILLGQEWGAASRTIRRFELARLR